MSKRLLYTLLFFFGFLTAQSQSGLPQWLRNPERGSVCFGKVSATADRDGDGYCLVQENGVIFWSDDGHQWHRAAQYVSGKLRCLDFYSRNNGVAAGDVTAGKQNIVYTTDGGKSWQGGNVSFNVRSVCMTSNNTAMLVGDGGNIAYYRLGGDATLLSSPVSTRLNSVSFFGNTGYACGEEGTLLKYESGVWKSLKYEDKDWVAATDPSERGISCTLNAIVAVDAQTVYAGGDNGVLLKTVDGGCEWSRRDVETTNNLTAITLKPDGDLSINAGGKLLTVKDNTDLYSVKMYYDRLGRVVASQNSKQHAMRPQRFSYTLYDRSGRNVESGELESDAEPTDAIINSTDVRFPDNWSKKRYQVVRSVYTDPIYGEDEDDKVFLAFGSGQKNLRNRIATTLYQEVYDPSSKKYDHATHYSYDVHGNICQVVYDRPELEGIGHRFKKIEYDYNLITSQVNRMDYQSGNPDGYSLKYLYDSENRLEKVYYKSVGESESEWHELASYEYYRHGPLARMVLGDTLQGVDYAYTLQGWIKGVNLEKEQGEGVRQDVYGYTLQYNTEDYKPIGNSTFNPTVDAGATNLYNGNISAMTTKLMGKPSLSEGNFMGAQTRRFVYDELNRLKESMVQSNSPSASAYHTSYAYDANGNIIRLTRNDQTGVAMDNLTYHYAQDAYGKRINNRLLHVNDAVSGDEGADIKNQGTYTSHKPSTHNYAYDEVGNLIKDKAEEVAEIKWTVTGKVSEVIRLEDSDKPDLRFAYDGLGHRISKTVYHKHAALGDNVQTTYYVRDLQGNILAVYEHKHAEGESGTFTLAEQHLYGASRIGMTKPNLALNTTTPEAPVPTIHYELTNHLGNVMAVITDEPAATETPAVESLADYYPFGMTMPGRSYNAHTLRHGFTGHEKESDLAEGIYTTEYRLYDARVGRWLSVDPLFEKYVGMSPYNYCMLNPVMMVDPDGRVSCTNGVLNVQNWNQNVRSLVQQRLNNPDLSEPARQQYQAILDGNGVRSWINSDGQTITATCGIATTDRGTPFLVFTTTGGDVDDRSNCMGWAMLGGQAGFVCGNEAQIVLNEEYIRKECSASFGDLVVINRSAIADRNIGNDGKFTRDRDTRGRTMNIIDHVAVRTPDTKKRGEANKFVNFRHKLGWSSPVVNYGGNTGGGMTTYDNIVRGLYRDDPNGPRTIPLLPDLRYDAYQRRENSVVPEQINP